MTTCLVLHDLGPITAKAEQAFFEAIFEIAPEHWRITGGATLAATDVSPRYLLAHLERVLKQHGVTGVPLLVTRVSPDMVWGSLSPEGAAWLAEVTQG